MPQKWALKMVQGSLVVQWLRLMLSVQGAWVRSLVREIRPCMLHCMVKIENKSFFFFFKRVQMVIFMCLSLLKKKKKRIKQKESIITESRIKRQIKTPSRDCPGGPVLRLHAPSAACLELDSWSGNWIPQAATKTWDSQITAVIVVQPPSRV